MIFLNWHVRWGHNSKTIIQRKKIKLTPEREFKTVFIGISKKTQSGGFQLVRRCCIFCRYCPPCLGSSAREPCAQCLRRFSSAHQWLPPFVGARESWRRTRKNNQEDWGWDCMGAAWPRLCSWWYSPKTLRWGMPWLPPLCRLSCHPVFPSSHSDQHVKNQVWLKICGIVG